MGSEGGLLGVILAGGRGRRIGGSKAVVALAGVPLIAYPLQAMRAVVGEVVMVAKPDTQLPSLPGVAVWVEPSAPQHPLVGIVHALELGGDRPVLVCAGDLPFVTPVLLGRIAGAREPASAAVLAAHDGELQPLLGCYRPEAIPALRAGLAASQPLRAVAAGLHPTVLEVGDPELLLNVNSPEDLLAATAILDRRRAASRR